MLFVCGVALTTWQVKMVVHDYLAYPVTTTVMVVDNGTLPFPAVTVCPVNRIKCDSLLEVIGTCVSDEANVSRACSGGKRATYCTIAFHAGCLRWVLRDAKLTDGANATATKLELEEMCPDHDADAVPWNSLEVGQAITGRFNA